MSYQSTGDTAAIMGDVSQFTVQNGTSPVVPTAGGNINIPDSSSIIVTGSANTLTFSADPSLFTAMTIQTTDATPTAMIIPITIPASSAWTIEALVVGAKTDYTQCFGARLWTTVRREAAGAPVRLTVQKGAVQDPNGSLNCSWILNGNDLELVVTGAAGTTINWLAHVRYVNLGV